MPFSVTPRIFTVVVLVCLMLITPMYALGGDESEIFERAVQEQKAGNYEDSLKLFVEVITTTDDPNRLADALWNAGSISVILEKYELALHTWKMMLKMDPEDWMVLEKLCQTYRGLGEDAKFSQQVNKLIALRQKGTYEALSNKKKFLAEQIPYGEGRIYIYYYFDQDLVNPANPYMSPVIYEAMYTDSNHGGVVKGRTVYGSYDTTNKVYQAGDTFKHGHRIYHFDYYPGNKTHKLLWMGASKKALTFIKASPILVEFLKKKLSE